VKTLTTRKHLFLIASLQILFINALVQIVIAETYYVSPNGSDNNNGTINNPFRTIQKAADIVNSGDIVIVKDGVYTDTDNDDRIVSLRRGGTSDAWIIFRSENKWGAVLDGENNRTGYGWNFGSDANYVRVENFEIMGCFSGGFWSNARAHHVYIYGNNIHDIGRACTDNADGLAGIYQGTGTSEHTYDSNIIHHIGRYANGENGCQNVTHYWQNHDHGIYMSNSENNTIINNIFYKNEHGWSLGISRGSSNVQVLNNTFVFSNPNRDGHIILWADPGQTNENIDIQNNIFYEPRRAVVNIANEKQKKNIYVGGNVIFGVDYVTVSDLGYDENSLPDPNEIVLEFNTLIPANNITGRDSMFVDINGFDFRLKSSSPAVNAGIAENAPEYDIESNPRPVGNAWDTGAYEYTGVPSFTANISASNSSTGDLMAFQFRGSASGGSPPYKYNWDFGDGNTSNQQNPIHNFSQNASYKIRLTVIDSDDKQTSTTRVIVVQATGPSVQKVKFSEIEQTEELTFLTSDKWYDLYLYVDDPQGWNDISFADVWLSHESNNNGTITNRGGIFSSASNYIMSYSIATDEIWAHESDGWHEITNRLGLYVDDDNNEYEQNSSEKFAKARMKLLENAEPGNWILNAYVLDNEGILSSLIQQTIFIVSPHSEPFALIALNDPSPTREGSVQVTLKTSKQVTKVPTPLTFTESDNSITNIDLYGSIPGDAFTGIFTIDATVEDGLGRFSLDTDALVDESENKGNVIITGENCKIDKTYPSKPRNVNAMFY